MKETSTKQWKVNSLIVPMQVYAEWPERYSTIKVMIWIPLSSAPTRRRTSMASSNNFWTTESFSRNDIRWSDASPSTAIAPTLSRNDIEQLQTGQAIHCNISLCRINNCTVMYACYVWLNVVSQLVRLLQTSGVLHNIYLCHVTYLISTAIMAEFQWNSNLSLRTFSMRA